MAGRMKLMPECMNKGKNSASLTCSIRALFTYTCSWHVGDTAAYMQVLACQTLVREGQIQILVVFLDKTLKSHSTSLCPGVSIVDTPGKKNTGKLSGKPVEMLVGNLRWTKHPIQGEAQYS